MLPNKLKLCQKFVAVLSRHFPKYPCFRRLRAVVPVQLSSKAPGAQSSPDPAHPWDRRLMFQVEALECAGFECMAAKPKPFFPHAHRVPAVTLKLT